MTTEHQPTWEEEAWQLLLSDAKQMLSEAARTIVSEALNVSYADNLVPSYILDPIDYQEAVERMTLAAAKLSTRDCELLAKLWLAALAAAASIDPGDERAAGPRIACCHLHWYYRMWSGLVEEILEKKRAKLQKEIAEWETEDLSDIPF